MPKPSTPAMPHDFTKFFEQALPNDGGRHMLALGELHDDVEHLAFLGQHLPEFKEKYGVQTIGLEREAFFNVFLWAYADGTLEKRLGSQEKVQDYLRAVFNAYSDPDYKSTETISADFAIAAMDTGIRITAFDCRDTLVQSKMKVLDEIRKLNESVAGCVAMQGDGDSGDAIPYIRKHTKQLDTVDKETKFAWMLGEIDWLLGVNPNYQARLNAMERLIEVGHQEICAGRLTSDGLSATLQLAQMLDTGNGITISGSGHIDGLSQYYWGYDRNHYVNVHGTFAYHLSAIGEQSEQQRPCTVTSAAILTAAIAKEFDQITKDDFCYAYADDHLYADVLAIAGNKIAHLKLDDGTVGELWLPPYGHPRVVPLEEKFPLPKGAAVKDIPAIHAAHLDPLKNPVIKQAFDELRALMHPPSKVYEGRLGNPPVMAAPCVN